MLQSTEETYIQSARSTEGELMVRHDDMCDDNRFTQSAWLMDANARIDFRNGFTLNALGSGTVAGWLECSLLIAG